MKTSLGVGFLSAAFILFAIVGDGAAQTATPQAPAFPSPSLPVSPVVPGGAASDGASVSGFRSANFGMTEAEVRGAIRRDFNLGPDAIRLETNAGELTTALLASVNDLLPNSGPARVGYVFGYQSKRLIQVTVTWGGVISPKLTLPAILDMTKLLSGYFVAAGYRPDSVVQNARAAEGQTIVFRGQDARGRMTLLVLTELPKQTETTTLSAPYLLQLSYILDVKNPDIFRIKRGQF